MTLLTTLLDLVLRLAFWLVVAPLLPGIINRVKAWVAGRRGPPLLQLYYDLARLWRKGVVLSSLASPGFVAGPAIGWVAVLGAALLLPLGRRGRWRRSRATRCCSFTCSRWRGFARRGRLWKPARPSRAWARRAR